MRAFHNQTMTKQEIYTNLRGKVGCITFQKHILKQVLSTWTNKKHLPLAINHKIESEATKAGPVWLHQALTSYIKGLPYGSCN